MLKNETVNSSNQIERSSFTDKIRLWLLDHPDFNPYKFSLKRAYRIMTNQLRVLPDFVVIGSTKSGTTSLHYYLIQHPRIISERNVHFFEYMQTNSIEWYRAHFPTKAYKNFKKLTVGEQTATYLFHPLIPKRIHTTIPNAKLIVVLRNPVDRAYSNYTHQVREGIEKRTFEEAIKSELKRIEICKNNSEYKINNDDFSNHVIFSYLRHGIYVDFIKAWMEFFTKEQFLILPTYDLNNNRAKFLKQVFDYLNVQNFEIKDVERQNVGEYKKLDKSMRKFLVDYYRPHNERLFKLLEKNFDWDK
jgi:hypothetical protein